MATETFSISLTGKATILKDPNAVLDYSLDWTEWLGDTDLLIDADWTVTNPLVPPVTPAVVGSSVITGNKVATVWVSGGDPGTKCALTCRITTVGGRIDDRTVYLKIKER